MRKKIRVCSIFQKYKNNPGFFRRIYERFNTYLGFFYFCVINMIQERRNFNPNKEQSYEKELCIRLSTSERKILLKPTILRERCILHTRIPFFDSNG